MPLRPDQRAGLDKVTAAHEKHQNVCLVQPTGTGKTYTAASAMLESTKRELFVVHRDILAEQTYARLVAHGLSPGMLTGRRKLDLGNRIVVATAQSLYRHAEFVQSFDRVWFDEAHRGEHRKIIAMVRQWPFMRGTGLTATPCPGGRGMAPDFDALEVGLSYPEALALNLILKPTIYAPMRPSLTGVRVRQGEYVEADLEPLMHRLMSDVMGAYATYCAGKRTLIFCVNRSHAGQVRTALEQAGHMPLYIDGETPRPERDDILAQWRQSPPRPLVNIGVFAEGYDEPAIEAIMLANPMKSLARYLQCAGRGCRTAPGKRGYLLVDCSGSVFDHGSPAAHRAWSLEFGLQKARAAPPPFRVCQKCFAVFEGARCELCGHVPEVSATPPKSARAELQLIPESFVPAVDATPKLKEPDLEMTDVTRLRRKLYAQLQKQCHEPVLTSRVSEEMKRRVVLVWRGQNLVLPLHTSLLW